MRLLDHLSDLKSGEIMSAKLFLPGFRESKISGNKQHKGNAFPKPVGSQ